MKKVFLVVVCLFLMNTYAQTSPTLDKIAIEVCEFLNSDELAEMKREELTAKFGLFVIQKYSEYKEDLKEEGFEVDFTEAGASEKFGQKIGINMVNHCPEALITLTEKMGVFDESEQENFISGTIKSIDGDDFSVVSIKDENGKIQKFYWMSNFVGSDKLIKNKKSKGLEVGITYRNFECFSPKLGEYIIRKEIVEIEYY